MHHGETAMAAKNSQATGNKVAAGKSSLVEPAMPRVRPEFLAGDERAKRRPARRQGIERRLPWNSGSTLRRGGQETHRRPVQLLLTARMPSLSRKRRIRFSLDSSRSKGSDPLSQNEPAGVATVAARPTISRLTSADRLLASDRCGKIVTLLESSMRRLEGLRKRYYRDALREFFFRQSLLGARGAAKLAPRDPAR